MKSVGLLFADWKNSSCYIIDYDVSSATSSCIVCLQTCWCTFKIYFSCFYDYLCSHRHSRECALLTMLSNSTIWWVSTCHSWYPVFLPQVPAVHCLDSEYIQFCRDTLSTCWDMMQNCFPSLTDANFVGFLFSEPRQQYCKQQQLWYLFRDLR